MNEDEKKLKISLEQLRKMINVNKDNWVNNTSTNCYAYALGLDIPSYEITDYAYDPGVISNSKIYLPSYKFFTYDMLINNIYSDLDALGIDIREIMPLENISDEEWKIALFTVGYSDCLSDYHFLRQHEDNIWYHKNGFKGGISFRDFYGNIITNPLDCYFRSREYNKTFALKLKK